MFFFAQTIIPLAMGKTKAPNKSSLENLSLGQGTTVYPKEYSSDLLEAFTNKHPDNDAWVSFLCPEFTSVCPKTNQPDFAHITINYIPSNLMVESKSLKLYLFSFRNHGAFHEDCIQIICNDLTKLIRPKFIEVMGRFNPRGGIALYPYTSRDNGEPLYRSIKEKRMETYSPWMVTPKYQGNNAY